MGHVIEPIRIGTFLNKMEMSTLVYRHAGHEPYEEFQNGFFAIRNGEEVILVDTGCASNDELAEMGMHQIEEGPDFVETLSLHGIVPEAVKTVIMTHLHWDHAWNLDKIPNAVVYVQKKELIHAIDPLPVERSSFGFFAAPGYRIPRWTRALDRIVALDGDAEVMQGIRVIPTPGHTHGSQTVLVDTEEGTYALTGDLFFHFESWEQGLPIGRGVSIDEWYESYRRLKKLEPELAGILPTHTHQTYERNVYGT